MWWFKSYKAEYKMAQAIIKGLNTEIKRLNEQSASQDALWRDYDRNMRAFIEVKDNRILDLEAALDQNNNLINSMRLEIADKTSLIESLRLLVKESEQRIIGLNGVISKQDLQILQYESLTVPELESEILELKQKLSRYEPCFDLGPIVERDGNWVSGVLSAKIPGYGSKVNRIPLDNKYWLCSQDYIKKIIEWDFIDQKQYLVDKFDCDDFSLAFKARAAGVFGINQVSLVIDYSSLQAFNLIIMPYEHILLLEPQNDLYWDIDDHDYKPPYSLQNAVILI